MSGANVVPPQALDATFRIQHLIRRISRQYVYRPIWSDDDIVLPRNCEIFVSGLPRNVVLGELVPLFANFGQIFEIRLMVNIAGDAKGFCYVTYTQKEMALNAIQTLHGYKLRQNGQPISCYPSFNNRRLFFEGLPLDRNPTLVEYAIRTQIPGVVKVILLTANTENPPYALAFVEFLTHRHAANCLGDYAPNNLRICGRRINMEFAVPSPPYIRNNLLLLKSLPRNLTKMEMLTDLVRMLPDPIRIAKSFKCGPYAMLRFRSENDALVARNIINEHGIRGPVITKLFDFNEFGEIELLWNLQIMKRENIRIPYRLFVEDYY